MNQMKTNMEGARGNENSPILFIGHSLPLKSATKDNLKEILDRRHVIYKSVIIPLKYYLNEYLIDKYKYKLPKDANNKDDIFRFINCFTHIEEKKEGITYFNQVFNKILFEEQIQNRGVKIIICMGFEVYYEILNYFNTKIDYKKIGIKSRDGDIRKLGKCFNYAICNPIEGRYILPILHNSANLSFHLTDRFIPPHDDVNDKYVSHDVFIAEKIADLIYEDEEIRKYLVKI